MAEAPQVEVRARVSADTAQFTRGMDQATKAAEGFSKTANRLRGAMVGIGVASGVIGASVIALGMKSFNAAARVEELDIAMNAVGKSTGLGYDAIRQATLGIKANGIEMDIAQKAALKFAQNNIDLSKAANVARVAQDLAVISGQNSSETFNMLTHAVITGRSEVLKSVGIQKSAGAMYEEFARSIGKSTSALTFQEKQQAVLNGVIEAGADVFGTYEAAMTAPGKVLRSFARVQNEILVSMGNVLLKGFGPMIFSAYNLVKAFAAASENSETIQGILEALRMVFTKLTEPIVVVVDKITEFIKGLDKSSAYVGSLLLDVKRVNPSIGAMANQFEMLLPVLAAATAGFATFGGRALLSGLPIIGKFMSMLKPLPVALVVLALTSTQVRRALANLLHAFKPLLPAITQIGKVTATASVIGVAVLAKAINILAGIVRVSINFFIKYIDVFKALAIILAVLGVAYLAYMTQVAVLNTITAIQTVLTAKQTGATTALTLAQKKLNIMMLANPIGFKIALIAALITAFGFLMATNENFREIVKRVFNFVIRLTIHAFNSIVVGIHTLIVGFGLIVKVLGFFAQVITKVFEFVIDAILTFQQFTLKAIKFVIDGFIELMETQGIFFNVVKTIFNGVIRIITIVVAAILNTFGNIVTGVLKLVEGFNFLLRGVRAVFFAVVEVIAEVGKKIFQIFETIAKGIGRFLGSSFDALTNWARSLASALGFIPGLANKVNSALDSVRNTIIAIPTKIVGLGQDAFNGIITNAKKAVNGVVGIGTAVETGLTKAEGFLKNFSAKVKEFGEKDNGAKIIDVMVKGAKTASGALGTMIGEMEKFISFDMTGPVGKFVDGISSKIDDASSFVLGLATQIAQFADDTDFAGIVGTKIGDFIDKVKDSLKTGLGFGDILAEEKEKFEAASKKNDGTQAAEDATKMADRLKFIRDAMQKGIESIRGVLDDLQQAAKDFADSLKDTIVGFAGLKSIELPDGFIPKAKSLITNMEQRLNKSKEFAGQISKLESMGLDADALRSIIEDGPIKGAQIAASLLGGGQSAIDEVSRLQKEIAFTGAVIGEFGSRVGFDQKIATASTQLRDLQDAETRIPTSNANSTFIQQGAFQVFVDTSGAADEEERVSIITRAIEKQFATLARELASK